jgi:hypothetical protein
MARYNVRTQLDRLEEAMRAFGTPKGPQVHNLLLQLGRHNFGEPESLIRFHEALLFIRAYPQNPEAFQVAEDLLASFAARMARIYQEGAEPALFDAIENSGIAGTTLHGTYSYGIARWLTTRRFEDVDVDWARLQKTERLGYVLPQLLPLLEEDALVEQNVPYQTWLRSARRGPKNDLAFLIRGFERSGLSERQKTDQYDLLELWIRWALRRSKASRTENRLRPREVFYHPGPLVRRADVSLEKEMLAPLRLQPVSLGPARTIIDMCRDATTVRYRELYGITYPDPSTVVRADVGRGVSIYLWGLPRERRLPLRAYHAGFTLKNGVPVNYIEGISLFERTELGFNTFYTFREGESAWIYAQAARALHQLTGVSCISLDPYQIGFNNDEAIQSGAFWFYRKLGFRPTRSDLAKLTETQEKKIEADRGYRTPARILHRLSEAPMIYELPRHTLGPGDWDRFRIRNLGLAVQRRMASDFDGDAQQIRTASVREVARAIGVPADSKDVEQMRDWGNLALVLGLIPDLADWTREEKRRLAAIIRAKADKSDTEYVRLLQKHLRLRKAMIKIGSSPRE